MSHSSNLVDAYQRKPIIHPYTPQHPSRPPHPSTYIPHNPGNDSRMMDPNESSWMTQNGTLSSSAFPRFSQWSEEKVATLQVRLARKLGPEYVTQRPGPAGGPKLSYIEGWKASSFASPMWDFVLAVINLANEVFGFNGWSSSIVSLTTDFLDQNDQGRVSVNVTAIVRITLQDGCYHEDVGCGQGENVKGKGAALDKAKKEAVTDATKRALKTFGNVLGNCLYDKDYAKEVVKVKVPPAKFNVSDLERRPEFTEAGAGPSRASAVPSHMTTSAKPPPANTRIPGCDSPTVTPGTPLRSVREVEGEDVLVDESFDAGFAGMEDDFFHDVDSVRAGGKVDGVDHRLQARAPLAGPSRPAATPPQPEQPVNQHRHRPEPPPPVHQHPAHHTSTRHTMHTSTSHYALHLQTDESGTTIASHDLNDRYGDMPGRYRSSGESSETLNEDLKVKRPVGGFAYPNATGGPSSMSAQVARAARALAISSELQKPSGPIRAESPRIPSGGIDAVAAKASTAMRVHGARLELDENETTVEVGFNGFSSARGMKRSISGEDRGSISPTKQPPGGPAYPQIQRIGPRKALGEIHLGPEPQQDDWGGKRQRAG